MLNTKKSLLALFCGLLFVAGTAAWADNAPPEFTSPKDRYNDAVQAISQAGDEDATIREHARLLILNADGILLPKVEAALKDPSTNPAARRTLLTAVKYLKPRYAKREAEKDEIFWLGQLLKFEWKRTGQQDERWNKGIERGLSGYAFHAVRPLSHQASLDEFDKAYANGCRDPLVISIREQLASEKFGPDRDKSGQPLHDAAVAMLSSRYSDALKAKAVSRAFYFWWPKHEKGLTLDEVIALYEKAAAIPKSEEFIASLFEEIAPFAVRDVGREKAMKTLVPAFKRAYPKSWRPYRLEGEFDINWAWDARGGGWASSVTPEGWKLFGERIDLAGKALLQAWERGPTHAEIAQAMITVSMARSDARGIEMWCKLGREADPDNRQICKNTLVALMPRWFGSHEAMLAFAHDCAASANYRGMIVSIILDAHNMIAWDYDDASTYLSKPEVWDDIRKVHEGYLDLDNIPSTHALYALWAARCGHWDVMEEQCNLIGDEVPYSMFGSKAEFERMRSKHILPDRYKPTTATAQRAKEK